MVYLPDYIIHTIIYGTQRIFKIHTGPQSKKEEERKTFLNKYNN